MLNIVTMPDPFSNATGIVPLLGAAIKCSLELRECVSDLQHAPESIATTVAVLKKLPKDSG